MNENEIKKLFWKIVNEIEGCSDTIIKNNKNVITEKGIQLSNGNCVMFGLDDGVIRVYNKEMFTLVGFTEDSEVLPTLKELFENLDL